MCREKPETKCDSKQCLRILAYTGTSMKNTTVVEN